MAAVCPRPANEKMAISHIGAASSPGNLLAEAFPPDVFSGAECPLFQLANRLVQTFEQNGHADAIHVVFENADEPRSCDRPRLFRGSRNSLSAIGFVSSRSPAPAGLGEPAEIFRIDRTESPIPPIGTQTEDEPPSETTSYGNNTNLSRSLRSRGIIGRSNHHRRVHFGGRFCRHGQSRAARLSPPVSSAIRITSERSAMILAASQMTDQVKQFLLNGGQQAYVMRIANGAVAAR